MADTLPSHIEIPCGVWEHAKGQHYMVIGIARDANNSIPHELPQVIYVSLEGFGLEGSRMRYRNVHEFLQRFTYVGIEAV